MKIIRLFPIFITCFWWIFVWMVQSNICLFHRSILTTQRCTHLNIIFIISHKSIHKCDTLTFNYSSNNRIDFCFIYIYAVTEFLSTILLFVFDFLSLFFLFFDCLLIIIFCSPFAFGSIGAQ